MNKFNSWWEKQSEHTREYLSQQPIWHDSDIVKASMFTFVIGILVGLAI